MKDNSIYSKIWFNVIIFFITTFVLGYIIYINPLKSDDIYFALLDVPTFKEKFDVALRYGNGRVLGNLLVQLLVRNKMAQVIVQTLVIISLPILSYFIVRKDEKDCIIIPLSIVIVASPEIFSQTYAWCSSFSNYVTGIFLALLVALLLKNPCSKFGRFTIFILAFLSQFFVESGSAINAFLSFVYMIYRIRNEEDNDKISDSIVVFIAMTLGFITMMGVSFFMPSEFVSNYRANSIFIPHDTFDVFLKHVTINLRSTIDCYFGCIPLILAFSIFVLFACNPNVFEKIVIFVTPIYSIYINYFNYKLPSELIVMKIYIVLGIIYMLVVNRNIARARYIKGKKIALSLIYIAILITMGLILVFQYSGGRMYLHPFFIFSCAITLLFYQNRDKFKRSGMYNTVLLLSFVIIFSFITVQYTGYSTEAKERDNYVRERVEWGEWNIPICNYMENYIWDSPSWGYELQYGNCYTEYTRAEWQEYFVWEE